MKQAEDKVTVDMFDTEAEPSSVVPIRPLPAKKIWDKESIQLLLATNDLAVDRAVVQIYRLQTPKEQANLCTTVDNGQGFTAFDAELLSGLAEDAIHYGSLTRKQRDCARPKIMKYWKQLLTIIEQRFGPQIKPKPCTKKQYLIASQGE